jgi:hypothetical protein
MNKYKEFIYKNPEISKTKTPSNINQSSMLFFVEGVPDNTKDLILGVS